MSRSDASLAAQVRRLAAGGARASRFLRGLALPWRAARFLMQQRALWKLAAVPAAISLVLLGLGVALVVTNADRVLAWWWPQPPEGALLLLWLAAFVAVLALGLVLAYLVMLVVGGVLASPFCDALSERTEEMLTGRRSRADAPFWAEALRSVGATAGIALLYLVLLAPVLAMGLVPGPGSAAATVLGALLSAFFLALEYTDATLARRGYGLRRKLRLLRANLPAALGFGLGASLLLWVPIVNLLCIPVAVIGGTALALGLDAEGRVVRSE